MVAAANGDHLVPAEEMTERERSIELVRTVRALRNGGDDLFERFGGLLKGMQNLTDATLMLVAAYRTGKLPSNPPPPVTASLLPPSRDKQQSYLDLEAMSRQAAAILEGVDGEGENTKVTRIATNVQVLAGVIEAARVNKYNELQRSMRLKTIAVWIGIISGGIPLVVALGALLLWVLRLALAYLGK